jgi:hypothetical protein
MVAFRRARNPDLPPITGREIGYLESRTRSQGARSAKRLAPPFSAGSAHPRESLPAPGRVEDCLPPVSLRPRSRAERLTPGAVR